MKLFYNLFKMLLVFLIVLFILGKNVILAINNTPKPLTQETSVKYQSGEILVKFKKDINPNSEKWKDEEFFIGDWKKVFAGKAGDKLNIYKKNVPTGKEDLAIKKLSKNPKVEYVEKNLEVSADLVPNDPYYSSTGSWGQSYGDLWGLHKIAAEGAWDVTTGSSQVVVAVIDTGVDYNHPDLKDNILKDSSGTVVGYDFANGDSDPIDDHGHGTHVTGTIAGIGNNGVGIAGVTWNTKIMPVKFLASNGYGWSDDGAKAITYSVDHGARVLSNSWGGNGMSQVINDAINYAHDNNVIIVAAAGNNNSDTRDFSPANNPNVIAVGASDSQDAKASFSNYGDIDVYAPGVDVLSVRASGTSMGNIVNNYYTRASGTSMATPHVSGLVALLLSKNPDLSNEEIRQIIRKSTDDLGDSGWDYTFGYGRIDAQKALNTDAFLSAHISSPADYVIGSGQLVIYGQAAGNNFSKFILEAGIGSNPQSWQKFYESTTPVENGFLTNWDSDLLPDGLVTIRLTVSNNSGQQFEDRAIFNVDNIKITSPQDGQVLSSLGSLDITGSAAGNLFSRYELSYGEGLSPNIWNNIKTSTTAVDNGILGNWQLPQNTNIYTIKLVNYRTDGFNDEVRVDIQIDQNIRAGWPKKYGDIATSPVFVDLNNDGKKEIVVGWTNFVGSDYTSSQLTVFDSDGNILPGWPKTGLDQFNKDFTFADLDGDGFQEIIASTNYNIYVFKSDGSILGGWPKGLKYEQTGDSHAFSGVPAVGDINNDGKLEVISYAYAYGSNNVSKVYAFDNQGNLLNNFPKKLSGRETHWNSSDDFYSRPEVTLADINNDDYKEIIVGDFDGLVHALNYNGDEISGWPARVSAVTDPAYWNRLSTPTVADIDNDGKLEIVINGADGQKTTVLKSDGTILPNWPYDTLSHNNNAPVIADLDRDGKQEIIVGNAVRLFVLNNDGTLNQNWQIPYGVFTSNLAVSDINNDGILEILAVKNESYNPAEVSAENWLNIYKPNGELLRGNPLPDETGRSSVIDDIDGDGRAEIGLGIDGTNGGQVYLWNTIANNANYNPDASSWSKTYRNIDNNSINSFYSSTPIDLIGPTGSITINNGNNYTQSQIVNLSLTAQDDSGVAGMKFSNDNINWSDEETFSISKQWQLTSGDGQKNVYVKFKDNLGNWSISYSARIILDTTKPIGSITIQNDNLITNLQNVNLTIQATDNQSGIDSMRFSNDGIVWSNWENYTNTRPWMLTSGSGIKTVDVQFQDKAGNISDVFTDSIMFDNVAPTGSIVINNGATFSNAVNVNLSISTADNLPGIISMKLSNDPTNWNSWETFSSNKNWTLTSDNGTKNVYIQFQDGAGNISPIYSDSIIFDNIAPIGSITINNNASIAKSTSVNLNLSVTDNLSGNLKMRLSNNNINWNTWINYSNTLNWTLSPNTSGTKYVYIQYQDSTGNISKTYSDSINYQKNGRK